MASRAHFISPVPLLRTVQLPDTEKWTYELKLHGYGPWQCIPALTQRQRLQRPLAAITQGLSTLPPDTVIDGEVVALDESGRPSFNLLKSGGAEALAYFVFDVVMLPGKDLTGETLATRRAVLADKVLPKLAEPIRPTPVLDASLPVLVRSVRGHGFEGLVAKRLNSRYESGLRTGAWQKMRVHRGQEFVIGGYTTGASPFDALIFGYYDGGRLMYAARTRNGFTPAVRARLAERFRGLETPICPFANLPETKSGRWGVGLTATKMLECRWRRPALVGQFEFLEWTPDDDLRHTRFVALREDKDAHEVVRET